MSISTAPEIINSTWTCYLPSFHKLVLPVVFVVIHRLSLARKTDNNPQPIYDGHLDAKGLCRVFSHIGMGTGGRTPYHVLVRNDARVEQLLPLTIRGAHTRGYNTMSWSIAVVGNYDGTEMSDRLWLLTTQVASTLAVISNRDVYGHTELPGASRDSNKRCPGRFVNMNQMRREINSMMPVGYQEWNLERRLQYIVEAGFSL